MKHTSSIDGYLTQFLALHPKLIDLKLDRTLRLLARLGNPHEKLPPVFHVAGTNGKGSTIAFLRAMLEADGRSVHVYTSPHLVNFHERIRLNGAIVDDERLSQAFATCEAANAGDPITFFEMTTAAAFWLFAKHPADVLLLEVGLGGRYDATNVVEKPLATVITPVSIDHRDYLGETIEKIAAEKAGILKKGVRAIIAQQGVTASDVIEAEAERLGAPVFLGGREFRGFEEHGRLVYEDEQGLLDLPLPRLAGRHQYVNASTAIAALRSAYGSGFSDSAIESGLVSVEWPARLQRLNGGRLEGFAPEGSEIWLDGGHNAAGGQVLAEHLAGMEEKSPKPLVLIVGMLTSKESVDFLRAFSGLVQEIYALEIPGQPNSRSAAALCEIARSVGLNAASGGDLCETLRFLSARSWQSSPRILICGSLYLAGEVLKLDSL